MLTSQKIFKLTLHYGSIQTIIYKVITNHNEDSIQWRVSIGFSSGHFTCNIQIIKAHSIVHVVCLVLCLTFYDFLGIANEGILSLFSLEYNPSSYLLIKLYQS